MSLIRLLSGLVSLAKILTGLFRDRRLIKTGESRAHAQQSSKSLELVRKANAARRAVAADPDGLPGNDPHNRDG